MSRRTLELVLDPVACDGRGVCAEMLPERIELDRWGYPVIDDAEIAPALVEHAVRAVRSCPKQALHLVEHRDTVLSPPLEELDERDPGPTRTARRVRWSRPHMVAGAASLVMYANGSVTVSPWGTDVSMTPEVAVPQYLAPIVSGGQTTRRMTRPPAVGRQRSPPQQRADRRHLLQPRVGAGIHHHARRLVPMP